MTGREIVERLAACGITATPDAPGPGSLTLAPESAVTAEVAALVRPNKDALLAHLRDLARMAEAGAAIGGDAAGDAAGDAKGDDAPGADAFPFGCNSPGDPDCEAATLLDNLEAAGVKVWLDRDDRAKLRVDPVPAEPHFARLKELRAAVVAELERRGAAASVPEDAPDPFQRPRMDTDRVHEGPVRGQPDGLAGPAGRAPAEAAVVTWAGWWRVPPGKWEEVCVSGSWGECWDDLRSFIKQSDERAVEATVIRQGRSPGRGG